MAKSANKKKKVKVDSVGEAHIHSSFNNIIISLTNLTGQVISGQVQEKWDSVDLRRTLLTLLNVLQKIVVKKQWITV